MAPGSDRSARWQRERQARKRAEQLLEEKSRQLFEANEQLRRLNATLEERVTLRTAELQQLNEELKRSEEEARKLSFVAARTTNAVILTDPRGRVDWVNQGFTRLTGYTLAEVKGKTPGSVLQGPETDRQTVEYMSECIRAGRGFRSEVLNYDRSGRKYWLEIEVQPIYNEQDRLVQFMAIESDITERKERETRDARIASMRKVFARAISAFLYEDDLNGVIGSFLSEAGSLLGLSRCRLLRTRDEYAWLFHSQIWSDPMTDCSEEAPVGRDGWSRGNGLERLRNGETLCINDIAGSRLPPADIRTLRNDGILALLAVPIIVFKDCGGIVTFEDSQRTRAWLDEEVTLLESTVQSLSRTIERRVAQRQLEEAAAKLKQAAQEARNASDAKSEFLANMSHEIRTPMTAIVGYADLLTRVESDAQLRAEWARLLRSNADYLLALLNDVLDLSKIEAGELVPRFEHCDLRELIAEIVSLMEPRATEKLLGFELKCDGAVPAQIHTDPLRLRQILINLVSNAIKFTEHGGVTLGVRGQIRATDQTLRLTFQIIDTGVGIESGMIQRLFEPFTQGGEGAISLERGTGLGLAISQSFARLLGGEVTVESTPGQGSTFTVEIDAGPSAEVRWIRPDQFRRPDTEALTTDAGVRLDGLLVHVVDDTPENRRILRFLLEEVGATVSESCDGEEALRNILAAEESGSPHHVVLMDMLMPVMNGYAATRELRSRGVEVPIIALTAFAVAGDREKCLEAGCSEYLTKPILPEQLRATLARYRSTDVIATPRRPARETKPLRSSRSGDARFAPLLEQYLAGLGQLLDQLRDAHARQDRESLRLLTHRLRGTGSSYGFPQITDRAAACEDALRSDLNWDQITPLYEALEALLRRCQAT